MRKLVFLLFLARILSSGARTNTKGVILKVSSDIIADQPSSPAPATPTGPAVGKAKTVSIADASLTTQRDEDDSRLSWCVPLFYEALQASPSWAAVATAAAAGCQLQCPPPSGRSHCLSSPALTCTITSSVMPKLTTSSRWLGLLCGIRALVSTLLRLQRRG